MSSLSSSLAVLREREFLKLFAGQTISYVGDGITVVAITFAVLGLTGSATDLGIVLAFQSVTLAGFALIGGVWADRLRREWVMIASDAVRMLATAALAVLLLGGWAEIWSLAVLAAVYGTSQAFFVPAMGGLVPQLVPPAKLQQANALLGMSGNIGWFLGPVLAGILIAAIGTGGAIAIDAVTFLASIGCLLALRVGPPERAATRTGFLHELRTGWREVRSRRWLWVMLLRAMLVLFVVIAPFQVLGPLALTSLGHGAGTWGAVMAVFEAGMFLGGAIALRYQPSRPMLSVALMGSAAVAAPLVLALEGGALPLAIVQGVRGIGVGILVAVWVTALQRAIPEAALSRVTAWDWMASMALWPLGLALAGPLADALGVRTACALTAGLGIVCALWVLLVPDVRQMRMPPQMDERADGAAAAGQYT
jgi:predicted MFS family arabinose efflux permease